MPKLASVDMTLIDEPAEPIRISMDEQKLWSLRDNMRELGLLSPIGLKKRGKRFEIEYGHRRFLAARLLKWKEISALIYAAGELQEGAAMLAENVEREDITAAEEAVLFAQAMERDHLDEAGLMKRFKRSANYIAERLRLLRVDTEVYRAVQERKISFAVAKELNKCSDEAHRRYLLDAAIRSGSGAGTIGSWVDQWRAQRPQPICTLPDGGKTPEPEQVFDTGVACKICGGYKDPYNLVSIYIHKWELDQILQILRRGPQEEPTEQSPEQTEAH